MIISGTTISGGISVGTFRVPDAPTIGVASFTTQSSATVTFTPPENVGGLPITGYTVVSNTGVTKSGTSSPITVTGLTVGGTYTFTVYATNIQGNSASSGSSNSVTLSPTGQILFQQTSYIPFSGSTAKYYQKSDVWTVPDGVTSISAVCIGSGGGAQYRSTYITPVGGAGGGLAYENNISVTPGETLYVTYGPGGKSGADSSSLSYYGSCSTIWRGTPFGAGSTLLCGATGGQHGNYSGSGSSVVPVRGSVGVAYIPGTGTSPSTRSGSGTTATGGYGSGGLAGTGAYGTSINGGGGGAGGYGGSGGAGADSYFAISNATAGTYGGGGGGGKTTTNSTAGAGGGTSPYGTSVTTGGAAGTNGASGTDGVGGSNPLYTASGRLYGGGGASADSTTWSNNNNNLSGGPGCVRIMWPGSIRQYPNTDTADV